MSSERSINVSRCLVFNASRVCHNICLICLNHLSGYCIDMLIIIIVISYNNLFQSDFIKTKTNYVKRKTEHHYVHIYIQFKWKMRFRVYKEKDVHTRRWWRRHRNNGFSYFNNDPGTTESDIYIYIWFFFLIFLFYYPGNRPFAFIYAGVCWRRSEKNQSLTDSVKFVFFPFK